eukprot:6972353-Ditylum_brightwellii.AAC.1
MQQWGLDFWETFSPVVMRITVRTLLTIASIHNLSTQCIDFALAFSQANLDVNVFMGLPVSMTVDGGDTYKYVLRLNKSIYGLKQSSLNWVELLSGALQKKGRDFKPSQVDPCLFIRKDIVVPTYVDDVMIIGTTEQSISCFIKSLKEDL